MSNPVIDVHQGQVLGNKNNSLLMDLKSTQQEFQILNAE